MSQESQVIVYAGEKEKSAGGNSNEAFCLFTVLNDIVLEERLAMSFFLVPSLRGTQETKSWEKNCFHNLKCEP